MKTPLPRRAFTLIELLVVISIIALLISILLPALTTARRVALQSGCASNMRQVGIASTVYYTDHKGVLPHNDGDGVFGNPKNYANTPLKAQGMWPSFLDYSDDPGSIGYGSTATTSGGLYRGLGVGRRAVLESTTLHCPQMLNNTDKRFQLKFAGYTAQASSDYVPSRNLGGVAEISPSGNPVNFTPPIPTDNMLSSDRMWFMEGIGNDYYGDETYKMHPYARLSQNPASWTGFNPAPVWWINKFSGLGHPNDAANVLYGDGHVASMNADEMTGMTGARFNDFAGYTWYQN